MSYWFFKEPVRFIGEFVRGLDSQNYDFLMVKTWTNCGESVVVCGSSVVVSSYTKESINVSAFHRANVSDVGSTCSMSALHCCRQSRTMWIQIGGPWPTFEDLI